MIEDDRPTIFAVMFVLGSKTENREMQPPMVQEEGGTPSTGM